MKLSSEAEADCRFCWLALGFVSWGEALVWGGPGGGEVGVLPLSALLALYMSRRGVNQ